MLFIHSILSTLNPFIVGTSSCKLHDLWLLLVSSFTEFHRIPFPCCRSLTHFSETTSWLFFSGFTYSATKKPNPTYVPSCSFTRGQGNGGKGKGEKGWGWNNWDSKGSDKGWDKGWGKGWGWGGRGREADGFGWMETAEVGEIIILFKLGQFCGVNYSNWMNKTWWFKAISRHIYYINIYICIIFIYLVVYTRARIRSLGDFSSKLFVLLEDFFIKPFLAQRFCVCVCVLDRSISSRFHRVPSCKGKHV